YAVGHVVRPCGLVPRKTQTPENRTAAYLVHRSDRIEGSASLRRPVAVRTFPGEVPLPCKTAGRLAHAETRTRNHPHIGSSTPRPGSVASRHPETTDPACSAGTRSRAWAKSPRLGDYPCPDASRCHPFPALQPSTI